ncbi:MAG: putative lipid II flippase FtsW, partial [Minisyncoccia bacterium]
IILLLIFGFVMISSASVVMSYKNFGYNYYYLIHQFLYGLFPGIVLMLIFKNVDYSVYKKQSRLFLIITIVLLLIVFTPGLSFGAKGASRWVEIWDFSFQPSEFAKLTFIMYLASWLCSKEKEIKSLSEGLIPFIVLVALMAIPLIFQPDLGTLIIIIAIATSMYFVSGAKVGHIFSLLALGVIATIFMIKIAPYRMDRLMVFLHPELDPRGIGYQINQALLALGSGGIFGLGFGHSRQKFNYLPEPMGDSIFAIIGEELGFIGLFFLVVLFLLFAIRGYKIVKNAPDKFGKFIAVGITSWIVFQAFMNIAAITSLIPLTGIPLPFISYGASSLVSSLLGMGILLNISKHSTRKYS